MSAKVEHLWKGFYDSRRREVLIAIEDIDLDIAPGEFICVLGPSGCGKSTLLRVLAGLETPDEGAVHTDGRPSMVFQDHGLLPWLTVIDNVAYPLRLRGMGKRERRAKVRPLLETVGLADFAAYYPHQLSGGMRQRTSVARALADDGPILLMDEPFGALDEQTRVDLQQELLHIWSRTGKSVVFITHSVDEAIALADRVVVMSPRPGRIVADIRVPITRPRDVLSLRSDPAYAELTSRLWSLLEGAAPQAESSGVTV